MSKNSLDELIVEGLLARGASILRGGNGGVGQDSKSTWDNNFIVGAKPTRRSAKCTTTCNSTTNFAPTALPTNNSDEEPLSLSAKHSAYALHALNRDNASGII